MGGLVEAYQEVARRLGLHVEPATRSRTGPVLVRSK
jgi:phosphoribosylaminoimidazole-succinocarboxamide synthase